MKFAELLIQYMARTATRYDYLAKKLGCSKQTVWYWMEGKIQNPSCNLVLAAAQVLRLTKSECKEFLTAADCQTDGCRDFCAERRLTINMTLSVPEIIDGVILEQLIETITALSKNSTMNHLQTREKP